MKELKGLIAEEIKAKCFLGTAWRIGAERRTCRFAIARRSKQAHGRTRSLTGLTRLDAGRRGRIGPVQPGPQRTRGSFARFRFADGAGTYRSDG